MKSKIKSAAFATIVTGASASTASCLAFGLEEPAIATIKREASCLVG